MSLFRQPRPRRFTHKMIYADERDERLREIEQRARRELAEDGAEKTGASDSRQTTGDRNGRSFRGEISFRPDRRPARLSGFSGMVVMIAAIVVLVMLMLFLMTGTWPL